MDSQQSSTGTSREGFVQFIAYLQVIGIILVVLGHSLHQFPDGAHGTRMLLYRLIYSFHMPLFIFVSGFLMVYTSFGRRGGAESPVAFTKKKVMRLLVPYVVLTLVTYVPRAAASGLADEALPLTGRGLLESLYVTEKLPIPYFWFLQASFVLLVVTYVVLWLCRRVGIARAWGFGAMAVILILASELNWGEREIFGLRSAVGFGLYFLAGGLYSEYYRPLSRWLRLDTWPSFALGMGAWLVSFYLWEGTALSGLIAALGIVMSVSLAQLLVRYKVRWLDHLVGANYLIFLLSWYFNVLFQQVLAHFVAFPWWVHTLLSLFFGLYVPWLAYRLMQRHRDRRAVRIAATLLGQKLK